MKNTSTFLDLERDESKLARLFEALVRNFYLRETPRFRLGSRKLDWIFVEEGDAGHFQRMETGILLYPRNDCDLYLPSVSRPWPEIRAQLVGLVS